jgi:hypothetical protein
VRYVEPVKKVASKPNNVFMVLESDSEEEENEQYQQEEKEKTEFPVLFIAPALSATNQKPMLNYSRIIDQANNPDVYAKAKEAEKDAQKQKEIMAWAKAEAARQIDEEKERQARDERLKNKSPKCSWVNADSSDEEDEEEDDFKVSVVDNSAW